MNALLLLVIALSCWVYWDAKSIGVRKGLMPGAFDMSPASWAGLCLLIWIVWLPLYLSKRGQLKQLADAEKAARAAGAGAQTAGLKGDSGAPADHGIGAVERVPLTNRDRAALARNARRTKASRKTP